MDDGPHASAQPTPSQMVAEHRSHADGHAGHDLPTPSQMVRDFQLTAHAHQWDRGHEMIEAEVKPPEMTWAQWVLLNRQQQSGNQGNEQNSLERGRVLPDEELDHDKGRDR